MFHFHRFEGIKKLYFLLLTDFPEKPSLSFKYIPCNNTVKYEVKFYKVFPVPTCTLYNKVGIHLSSAMV